MMPGFNAEASLYRAGESYRSTAGWAGVTGAEAVVAQQFLCRCFCLPFGLGCFRCCVWPPGCSRVASC